VKLISINLLGSIKKLIGHSNLQINEEELANVNGIISYLENNYYSNNKINENEILVAINGIEFSLLGGHNAKISSGDVVTILSIVHGG
jgi:molybdopterin synthase sulfur carrier subunit